MFKRVTHPLARWLAVASIAWLTLAPTAFRVLSLGLPTVAPWQQICTAHAGETAHSGGASSVPQHDEGASDCPLCVLCHHGWAPAPAAVPAIDLPQSRQPWLAAVPPLPHPAAGWVSQNPRAPPGSLRTPV